MVFLSVLVNWALHQWLNSSVKNIAVQVSISKEIIYIILMMD
jgi:hypothetical protein